MHASMLRLLNLAREATAGDDVPVNDFAELGRRLGQSSAVMTNWKKRGVSKEGAIAAVGLFGGSVSHILSGDHEPIKPGKVPSRNGPLAHGLSYQRNTLQPLTREQVMERLDELHGEFWVELWDDAISKEYRKGTPTLWDADLEPEFGDIVIIKTPDGEIHVRVYAESLATGWQGKTLNDDYDPIPGSNSAKVIAVFLSAKARRSRRH